MIFDRFETTVVPFPFAEVPQLKRRPAVVVSARSFNESNGSTLVAMVTTAKATSWPSDIVVTDLETAGLSVPCIVRWRLTTLPNELLLRPLGRLGAVDRLACERGLAQMLVG